MAEDKFYSKFQKKSSDKTTINKKTNDKKIDLKKSGSLVEREIKTEKNPRHWPITIESHTEPSVFFYHR